MTLEFEFESGQREWFADPYFIYGILCEDGSCFFNAFSEHPCLQKADTPQDLEEMIDVVRLGSFDTLDEAKAACKEHYEWLA